MLGNRSSIAENSCLNSTLIISDLLLCRFQISFWFLVVYIGTNETYDGLGVMPRCLLPNQGSGLRGFP